PYGAIQMHKDGIIPESSFGWRFAPVSALPNDWFNAAHRERDWQLGSAPFVYDREFRSLLAPSGNGKPASADAVAFRYDFEVGHEVLGPNDQFILTMTSMDEAAAAWINGKPVIVPAGAPVGDSLGIAVSRRKSRDYGWWEIEAELPAACFQAGRN